MRVLSAVLCLLLSAPVAEALEPGDFRFELQQGNNTRSYLVHIPEAARRGQPLPVVISFHGGMGTAKIGRRFTGLDETAERHGFISVHPDGSGRTGVLLTWNAGGCCAYAASKNVDDVGFTRMLVADLERRTEIDRRRIYVTGMSNGGMMAHRVAAEAPDLIAAAAPVAGSLALQRISPQMPVPIMHVHSVDDSRALYDGGLAGRPSSRYLQHPAVEPQIAKWVEANGCSSAARVTERRVDPETGHTAERFVWGGCTGGAEVALWKLTGGGHVWPGGRTKFLTIGAPTDVIDANEEMWAFFRRFSR